MPATVAVESGILLYDKPKGVTSHDIVDRVRRERGGKVGHAGTLDPFATGLLTILLGRATRLQPYFMGLEKTYVARAKLGWTSTTGDPDGELTETGNVPDDLTLPTGTITQMVPMTSAVKVDGERLYKKAHRGEEVERPSREVEIHEARLLDSGADFAEYEIRCSSGTYVRTLIETLGDAYCAELRRTAVGPLSLDRAGDVLTPGEALTFLPEVAVNERQAVSIGYGQQIGADPAIPEGEPLRLVNEGNLIAVAHRDGKIFSYDVVLEPQG